MAFPLNSAGTATLISALPFTVADTFGGAAFGETWFVYTAGADDLMLGVHLASTANNPFVEPFRTIVLNTTVPGYCDKTHPIQTPVTAGTAYYFKLTGETTGTATITLTIHGNPTQTIADGQMLMPDPSHLAVFPPTILDFDAQDVTNIAPMVGGNYIDQLPDGTMCIAEIPVAGSITCTRFVLY